MTNKEKIDKIQYVIDHPNTEEVYYALLKNIGALKQNYWEYMTTEPINCDVELERIKGANFDLCGALMTMMLREDHFCEGSLMRRQETGQVEAVLGRMIECLMSDML